MSSDVIIYGSTGVGKSMLARCIAREAFMKGYPVIEINARRFYKIACLFAEGDGQIKKWFSVPILLINDIDKCTMDKNSIPAWWELLEHRRDNGKCTIITTNKSLKELKQLFSNTGDTNDSYGNSIADRLKEGLLICMSGESNRQLGEVVG